MDSISNLGDVAKKCQQVSNVNVIDLDSYEELLDRFGSMIKALEKYK